MKAQISSNLTTYQLQDPKQPTKHHTEDDREKQVIQTLRQDQHMKFASIANLLNHERRQRGEPAEWTEPAVYSCFVRNVPKIPTAVCEIGFDPRDYMHLRNPSQSAGADGGGTVSKAGRKRVRNYENATELKGNVRVKLEHDGELEMGVRSEQLVLAVARVERNFWVLVAEEMERVTTRLYEPEVLASWYHSI